MLSKFSRTGGSAAGLIAPALALWALLALPGQCLAAQQDAQPGKRSDSTMSTAPGSERLRMGQDEQGDSTMTIERKPAQQDQTPAVGPIYVVPQVNTPPYGLPPQDRTQPRAIPNQAPRGRPQ